MTPAEPTPDEAPPCIATPSDLTSLIVTKLGTYATVLNLDRRRVGLAAIAIAIVWLATSFYRVQPDEQGLVLRAGRMVEVTGPGFHVHWPYPFETVLLPNVTRVNQLQVGLTDAVAAYKGNQMLTGDENIVDADCAVFWKVKDAVQFAFNLDDAERTLALTAASAIREVVGRNPIQSVLSDKREPLAEDVRSLIQNLLDQYGAGIEITQVQLQRADPPSAVIDAFNDVQRARADQEKARNDAEAYRNDILPRARGEAQNIQQQAEAYKARTVSLAEGETKGFLAVYDAYRLAPETTAWRLYLDTLDELLKRASKVVIDSSDRGASGVLPYLPIGELGRPAPSQSPARGSDGGAQ